MSEMGEMEQEEARKQRMIARLGGSSFLVFFFDHWFGVAAAGFLVVVTFLGLFLPRIWRQTPPDFTPVLKVSGLDLWQARSLKNTALKQAAAGRVNDAVHAWRSAIANNPADKALLRGGLGYVAGLDEAPEEHLEFAVNYAFWLLRLGQTNAADGELALRILAKYELPDYVVRVGETMEDRIGTEGARLLLRSYFEQAQTAKFDRLWTKRSSEFTNDVELVLFRQAWKANWGPAATLYEGREALRAAMSDPKLRNLAMRLQLQVSYAMRDEATYREVLKILDDERKARLSDHVQHWLLMFALGRRDEAREKAKNFTVAPKTPVEARMMAGAMTTLGLGEFSITFLDQQLRTFGFDADLWLLQSDNLIAEKQWSDLRTLAFAIRNEASLQGMLDAYSHYLEALAESNLERPEAARAAADRVVKAQSLSPGLTRVMAQKIKDIGYPDVSSALLRQLETTYKNDPMYWFDRSVAAFLSGNVDELVASAEKAYALKPTDSSIVNNYAAVLLLTRRNPAEAVQLTFRVMTSRPGDVDAELNHALALLQNTRLDDAAEILRRMNTLSLTASETAVYHLAWFEFYMGKKDWASARLSYGKIETRRLLAPQASWVEDKVKTIPAG